MKKISVIIMLLACLPTVCHATKYVGGDISLLPNYEAKGAVYYDSNGTTVITDVLGYMKAAGMNAMRVRLFVDPSQAGSEDQGEGVCQDLPYVISLGQRIKAKGMKLLLDIHYSDTWTDPGQHSTPASWTVTSALADSVYSYTCRVLTAMNAAQATPDFIQVGNEVTYGMLWPTGRCYPNGTNYGSGTFANFANYLKRGLEACRTVCPQAQLIVHTEMSRTTNVTNFYATLRSYTDNFDIIGLSYYPAYHGALSTLDGLLTTLEATYPSKKIQIVETGYYHAYYPDGVTYDLTSTWPATEAGQLLFTQQLVALLNTHSNVNGLYWWFPEANEKGVDWHNPVTTAWYNAGLWDNSTGRVMAALAELQNFQDATPADITGDDQWTMADVTTLIAYILGNNPNPCLVENCDVTGDGSVSMADVTTLIARVLGDS